ncbi:MAG: TnpV protein [Oscillospiraceae bacterium]|nr:TnpV protein [Oscillospiraceae bacterium]
MKEHYINEKTGISYTLWGDYYLPDLLPAEEEFEIGIWGQRYLRFIKNTAKSYTRIFSQAVCSTLISQRLMPVLKPCSTI